MTELTLYLSPGSCARVPLIGLEETGHPFAVRPVALASGEQRTPAYLALNPRGKVPVLVIDGTPLTENVAILTWLAGRFPEARLLPDSGDIRGRVAVLSDLAYCSSTLQGFVPRMRLPQSFCDSDPDRVRAQAIEAAKPHFALVDKRLADGWWYGADWSLVDAYLAWVWFRATGSGFDGSPYANYTRHAADMAARPAFQRALTREQAAQAEIDARAAA